MSRIRTLMVDDLRDEEEDDRVSSFGRGSQRGAPYVSLEASPNEMKMLTSSYSSRGASFKDVAMLASFDTSTMVLAAAGDGSDQMAGYEKRRGLTADSPFTVWGHGAKASDKNTYYEGGSDDKRQGGDIWGYNLGLDYKVHERLFTGVSLGYTETDMTTTFNTGTYDEINYSVSPYAVYQPTDRATISLITGYSIGDIDRTRDTTAITSVTSDTESYMWFASVAGEYELQPLDDYPFDIKASVSFLASKKTIKSYAESDGTQVEKASSNTREVKPGLEMAYRIDAQGTTLQPFVNAHYIYDFKDNINGDDNAYNLGGGVRFSSGGKGIFGSIEGEKQLGRSNYHHYTFSGQIAYSFDIDGTDGGKLGIASPYVSTNFSQAGSNQIGIGFKFINDGGYFKTKLDLTRSIQPAAAGGTVGRLDVNLRF